MGKNDTQQKDSGFWPWAKEAVIRASNYQLKSLHSASCLQHECLRLNSNSFYPKNIWSWVAAAIMPQFLTIGWNRAQFTGKHYGLLEQSLLQGNFPNIQSAQNRFMLRKKSPAEQDQLSAHVPAAEQLFWKHQAWNKQCTDKAVVSYYSSVAGAVIYPTQLSPPWLPQALKAQISGPVSFTAQWLFLWKTKTSMVWNNRYWLAKHGVHV